MIRGLAIIVLLVTGSYFLCLWERNHKNPDWKKLACFLLTLAALPLIISGCEWYFPLV
jgi:hypothetical protein